MVSLAFILVIVYSEGSRKWVQSHPGMWLLALIVMVVTLISMACCTNVRRKAPMNFIFLGLFTLAQSFILAMVASSYNSEVVSSFY